jgi:hypothetical protein
MKALNGGATDYKARQQRENRRKKSFHRSPPAPDDTAKASCANKSYDQREAGSAAAT